MKKQILSASVIALTVLLASCSKNEIMQETPGGESSNVEQISFRSSTGNTRANDNGLTELAGGFNVVGIDKNDAYIPGFANPTGDVETYWKDGAAWGWKTTPLDDDKKWPTTDVYPLTFFMAYPKTDAINKTDITVAANVESNMTPNTTYPYNTFYDKVAVVLDATKLSVDELAAKTLVVSKPASGFANLSFKHIMSNILFDVKVPADVKAVIHSIKIANVNKSGRTYDYKAQEWSTEPSYAIANHAHYAHFVAAAAANVQSITPSAATVNGFSDGATGYNTLKLMPQISTVAWKLGADANEANSFKKDAAAWKATNWRDATLDDAAADAETAAATAETAAANNPSDVTLAEAAVAARAAAVAAKVAADAEANTKAINYWHKEITTNGGMIDSDGWMGARIEVIYCLVDTKNGKNLIGRLEGVDGAAATQFVRVGYLLDIPNLETTAAVTGAEPVAAVMGLTAGYKYKFTIALGTADATNGVLLDPDFKDENGGTTDTPVDNPKVTPGDPITKDGVIEFNVAVDEWEDYAGDIK